MTDEEKKIVGELTAEERVLRDLLSRIPPEEFREDGKIFRRRRDSTEYECRDEKTGELLYYIRFD